MSGGKHGRKPTQGDQRKKPVVQGYSVHSYFRVDIDIIYWWPADGTLSVLTLHHTQYNTCWICIQKSDISYLTRVAPDVSPGISVFVLIVSETFRHMSIELRNHIDFLFRLSRFSFIDLISGLSLWYRIRLSFDIHHYIAPPAA